MRWGGRHRGMMRLRKGDGADAKPHLHTSFWGYLLPVECWLLPVNRKLWLTGGIMDDS